MNEYDKWGRGVASSRSGGLGGEPAAVKMTEVFKDGWKVWWAMLNDAEIQVEWRTKTKLLK